MVFDHTRQGNWTDFYHVLEAIQNVLEAIENAIWCYGSDEKDVQFAYVIKVKFWTLQPKAKTFLTVAFP